ncbi:MAG: hypothetical protein NHB14_20750 [Desulfosporosinus sp.]|nr:hypothetical protein [Desulfosporosinus sp.]
MAFLTEAELTETYYKKAVTMDQADIMTYLARANAFAKGEIGGEPPTVDADLKVAVAMAFEIMAQGETAQVNDITGNITEAAPPGQYTRKEKDPLDVVRVMLRPYKLAFEAANTSKSDRGVLFL